MWPEAGGPQPGSATKPSPLPVSCERFRVFATELPDFSCEIVTSREVNYALSSYLKETLTFAR